MLGLSYSWQIEPKFYNHNTPTKHIKSKKSGGGNMHLVQRHENTPMARLESIPTSSHLGFFGIDLIYNEIQRGPRKSKKLVGGCEICGSFRDLKLSGDERRCKTGHSERRVSPTEFFGPTHRTCCPVHVINLIARAVT